MAKHEWITKFNIIKLEMIMITWTVESKSLSVCFQYVAISNQHNKAKIEKFFIEKVFSRVFRHSCYIKISHGNLNFYKFYRPHWLWQKAKVFFEPVLHIIVSSLDFAASSEKMREFTGFEYLRFQIRIFVPLQKASIQFSPGFHCSPIFGYPYQLHYLLKLFFDEFL